ncbi:MAG TPA: hypothetical protein VF974_06715 [Patescibacteria group bacterium]
MDGLEVYGIYHSYESPYYRDQFYWMTRDNIFIFGLNPIIEKHISAGDYDLIPSLGSCGSDLGCLRSSLHSIDPDINIGVYNQILSTFKFTK